MSQHEQTIESIMAALVRYVQAMSIDRDAAMFESNDVWLEVNTLLYDDRFKKRLADRFAGQPGIALPWRSADQFAQMLSCFLILLADELHDVEGEC